MSWLDGAAAGRARTWVRGELAATLRPEPEELDVVALVDRREMALGEQWVARVLEARPRLWPIELVFATLHPGDVEAVDLERRRSAVRCRDTMGEPVVTGWLEVIM